MSQHDLEGTGRTIRSVGTALHPPTRPGIMDIHHEATKIANGGHDDPDEFVVAVETSDVLIVRAESAELAIAKVMLSNPERADDDIETVSHNVHACVHSGEEYEPCDQEGEDDKE